MKLKTFLLTSAVALSLAAPAVAQNTWWRTAPSGDADTTAQLDRLLEEGAAQVGLPNIVNFFEARMVKMLYELRDSPEYRTYAYTMAMDGTFIKLCDSIGFGINASIQMANPNRAVSLYAQVRQRGAPNSYEGLGTLPQAEPNALFMPEGLASTYVICVGPEATEDNPNIQIMYLEPDVIVSPWPLFARDSRTGEMVDD